MPTTPNSPRALSPIGLNAQTPPLSPSIYPSRPVNPKRQQSLQLPARPSPYPTSSSSSSSSTSTLKPQRPGAPRRAHSFCASSPSILYALASAGSGTHLAPDKKTLVAPPLERTLSSMGARSAWSSSGMTLPPLPAFNPQYKANTPSPHSLPKITISPSMTPPRLPLGSSRSSSEISEGPATPSGMIIFGKKSQKGLSLKASRESLKQGILGQGVEEVVEGVDELTV